jgi:hypothetical protein
MKKILLSFLFTNGQTFNKEGSPFIVSSGITWSNNGTTATVTARFNCENGNIGKPYPATSYFVLLSKVVITGNDTTYPMIDGKISPNALYAAATEIVFEQLTKDSLYEFTIGFSNDSGSCQINVIERAKGDPLSVSSIKDREKECSVLPNPFRNLLSISSSETQLGIKLIDITGREVLRESLSSGTQTISTADIPSGMYLAVLENSEGIRTTKKIFKE